MKKLLLLWLALSALSAFAQNVRYDAPYPSVSSQFQAPFLVANVPPNSPVLAVCHSPANAVPCTNYATTYTSAAVACSNGAQDTPQPQPSACQSTGDAQGNIGFWAPAGTYDYTVCIAGTVSCFGPYTVTLGGSGGGGGTLTGTCATLDAIALWTGSSALGCSGLTDITGTLTYSGTTFDFAGAGANIGSTTPGVQVIVSTPSTTGTTSAGSFSVLPGSSGGTAAGGGLFLEAANANSGAGGPALIQGGTSTSGAGGNTTVTAGASLSSLGGNLYLNAGANLSGTNGDAGVIVFGGAESGSVMQPLYLPSDYFAHIRAPQANPFPTSTTHGAHEWCIDCAGILESAAQGSIAGGSGSGAEIYYDGTNWRVETGASGVGTVVGAARYDFPYYSAAGTSTTLSGVAAPTVNSTYYVGYSITGSAAVAPSVLQVGVPTRSIAGAATTDTVLYSDVGGIVTHDQAASGSVNESLPTATSLGNPHFAYKFCNNSAQTDTITPVTWTIQAGASAAGSSVSVTTGTCYTISIDSNLSTQWHANH